MQKQIILKHRICLFICLCTILSVKAQTVQDTASLSNIRTANDLKSGNWQDVFSSFFQLATSDLTGPKKTFSFQSTLFAMKTKANPSILIDTNYIRHKLDRNLQFAFTLGLDSNFSFHGFAGSITWAAINKRDSTTISFVGTKLDPYFAQFADELTTNLREFRKQFIKSGGGYISKDDSILYTAVHDSLNLILASRTSFNMDKLPAKFKAFLIANHFTTQPYDAVIKAYQDAIQKARTKPLLTLSLNSAFTKAGTFDSAAFGVVFLQGLTRTGKNLELDLRGGVIVKDSTIGANQYRTRSYANGGFDFALISTKDAKSGSYIPILEFKPYMEYDHIFSTLAMGEKADYFVANAELRLRITDNLWLPLTLKYDLSRKSFLGFLSVSFNMNSFSAPKKVAG